MAERTEDFYPLGVVFDMDGLMFDSERIVQYSWNVAGEKMGYGALGDDNIPFTLGFNREKRSCYFKEKYGQDFPYEEFHQLYGSIYYEYTAAHGLPVKTGLYELLDVLKEKKLPCAVATSSSRDNALGNLKKAGVLECFRAVVTGDMVTKGKPDPEIYRTACQCLALPENRMMALEDAPNGILSAHRAGMYTVFVPDIVTDRSGFPVQPDREEASLLQVAEWLSR